MATPAAPSALAVDTVVMTWANVPPTATDFAFTLPTAPGVLSGQTVKPTLADQAAADKIVVDWTQ